MSLDFIPTRGSAQKQSANKHLQVVTFTSRKPKEKLQQFQDKIEDNDLDNEGFNIKKARWEVIKFGTSGFDAKKRQVAKIEHAVRLGAKPPKNKNINYKTLIKERKKEKQQKQAEDTLLQSGKNSIGVSKAKGKSFDRKRRKAKGDLLGVYGTVKPSEIKKK